MRCGAARRGTRVEARVVNRAIATVDFVRVQVCAMFLASIEGQKVRPANALLLVPAYSCKFVRGALQN